MRATHEDRDELGRALVNDRWPGTALTTMPPDLLAALPPLPPELEYLFAHRDLVLWDVRADVIIDVLRDAVPLERARTPWLGRGDAGEYHVDVFYVVRAGHVAVDGKGSPRASWGSSLDYAVQI
jgi:hypothetical protein